ncbi:MAG: hypothetical protein LBQ64_07005 [Bacteroidales bacterium]|jgi:hypothetical protein|nr:hypothetical protein [Bacteroidales bacterium]
MKKRIIYLILLACVCIGCKKENYYTPQQLGVQLVLTGNYHAYDKNAIVGVISFKSHYSRPVTVSDNDNKKPLYEVHGECTFSDYGSFSPDEGYIACYYALSKEANSILFYYKGGTNSKKLLKEYTFAVQNMTSFQLTSGGRTMLFEKVIPEIN